MKKQLVILTGLSGAGRSTASFVLEELKYRVIDNLPAELIESLLNLLTSESAHHNAKTAITINIMEAEKLILSLKKSKDFDIKLFLFVATKEDIISRYKLTRHLHPLQVNGLSLEDGIDKEMQMEARIREQADFFIDTSNMRVIDLRKQMFSILKNSRTPTIKVNLVSFGFKYGLPLNADIIFDARLLPNPFYIPELKNKTGKDQAVVDFLNNQSQSKELIDHIFSYLVFYLSKASEEARGMIVVAIGCSGGQHRSVYCVERVAEKLKESFLVSTTHRDLRRGER